MSQPGRQGLGHGIRLNKWQMAVGQRQRSGDYPDHRPRGTEAQGAHRCDAADGWHPALPSRSRRGGRLRVGDRSPEAALIAAPAASQIVSSVVLLGWPAGTLLGQRIAVAGLPHKGPSFAVWLCLAVRLILI